MKLRPFLPQVSLHGVPLDDAPTLDVWRGRALVHTTADASLRSLLVARRAAPLPATAGDDDPARDSVQWDEDEQLAFYKVRENVPSECGERSL